ncbi:MAG: PKD domain-containing protein [Candidatus Pacearchaeota archaeon]
MNKKFVIMIIFSISIILLSSFPVEASIAQGTPFFNLTQISYGPGQVIEGFVNFSITNQVSNTKVSTRISGVGIRENRTTTLLDFLKKAQVSFTCNPASCLTSYATSGQNTEKNLDMQEGQESLVAFKIPAGSNTEIQDFSFKIAGSASGSFSCEDSIIKLDLLDDGSIDWEYVAFAEENNCSDFIGGCFTNINTQDLNLDSTLRCEKIKIGKTGKADLGVFVNLDNPENQGNLLLLLYDPLTQKQYNCTVESAGNGPNFCTINFNKNNFFINSSRDVFVCVRAISGAYTIKVETDMPCGFFGNPQEWQGDFTSDYPLYLKYYGFSSMNEEFVFSNETFTQGNLKDYLQAYINSRYSKNCQAGCVIPLKFIANANQTIQVSEPLLNYNHTLGSASNNYFYNATANYATITMPLSTLQISFLNISAPSTQGTYTFDFQIATISASAQFRVEDVPIIQNLQPLSVIPDKATTFYVTATAPAGRQIVNYTWQWGDGSQDITTTAEATHTYAASVTPYTLTITVKDTAGLQGSRSFAITSNLTKETLNNTLLALKTRLNNITQSIGLLESWYSSIAYSYINLTQINSTLNSIELQLPNANENSFQTIRDQLQQIDSTLPLEIITTENLEPGSYFSNPEMIDPGYVKDLGGGNFNTSDREKLANKIAVWQEKNLDVKVEGNIKAFKYQDHLEEFVTILEISIDPEEYEGQVYFVFVAPENINPEKIKSSETLETLDGALGKSFDLGSRKTIKMAVPGKKSLFEMNFFIAPPLSELRETLLDDRKGDNKLLIFLIIVIIIAVAIGLFLIWHKTPKSQLENLFRNEADLAGLINFIMMGLGRGMQRKEIENQLMNSGWSKKQIDYAFKQLGKPTKQETQKSPYDLERYGYKV